MTTRIASTFARSAPRACLASSLAGTRSAFARSVIPSARSFASSSAPRLAQPANEGLFPPSPSDPAPEHVELVEKGTKAVADGNYEEARKYYEESLKYERNGTVLFNKGVVEYCLKDHQAAISSWLEAIAFDPEHADAHTNLASAYICSTPPRGDFAEKHLRTALSLNPLDPEVSFNLAAVLEARGQLQESLTMYERARGLGVARADQNVRSLGAKILAAQEREGGKSSSGSSSA